MASMTYYVALAFMRSEGGDIVACEPKEACRRHHSVPVGDIISLWA
jgi:hypothetical protein